jgi:hypothetical protein
MFFIFKHKEVAKPSTVKPKTKIFFFISEFDEIYWCCCGGCGGGKKSFVQNSLHVCVK